MPLSATLLQDYYSITASDSLNGSTTYADNGNVYGFGLIDSAYADATIAVGSSVLFNNQNAIQITSVGAAYILVKEEDIILIEIAELL